MSDANGEAKDEPGPIVRPETAQEGNDKRPPRRTAVRGQDTLTVIEHRWLVQFASRAPDETFDDEASALQHVQECGVGTVVEYVPADQLQGAVEERDAYKAALESIEGSPRAGIGSDQQAEARAVLNRYRGQ